MNAIFKALNDVTRREILELLKEKDLSAGDIAASFDISKPSISSAFKNSSFANGIVSNKSLPIPVNCAPCPGKTYAFILKNYIKKKRLPIKQPPKLKVKIIL